MNIRIIPSLLLLALLLSITAGCIDNAYSKGGSDQQEVSEEGVQGEGGLIFIRDFEGGRAFRTKTDRYWVLHLSGSWMEMGRQYGGLMNDELRLFHDEIVADISARGVSKEMQHSVSGEMYEGYSPGLKDLLEGISLTSGMTMDEVLITNAGVALLTDAILGDTPPGACSGIAVWDGYTEDGRLIFGRNWDINREAMKKYMKYLSVVVYCPDERYSVANIHPLGNVYLETGMNSDGLFIELNNGEFSDKNYPAGREDTSSFLVTVLTESRNVTEAVDMLKNTPADISYILQIADPDGAVSLERATFDARVRNPEDDGLVIAVNHFIPPYPQEWEGKVQPPRSSEEDPRYDNLLSLAGSWEYKGLFTPSLMKDFLGVPMESGGAWHDGTVYQVIAVPESRTVWLHAIDYADWEEVPLAELLRQ
ncbi:C45 family peptidase [Methanocalculus sp.]|uniref:C45 family autoproteolytic acyltransferase/hydolase n=1 Tax=Methanocalculus sp. TaxID=2004547 RepID=UPI00271FDDD6|nr:C45 family peptidase [Methanocalculus sp.]MDO8840992.1 C45 family peptidase [Methanocalculus sp.]